MVTLLTATGGRPLAFDLCIKWMNKQTYKGPIRWIIVDDCSDWSDLEESKEKIRGDWEVITILPEPKWFPGDNTQSRNLLAGLQRVNEKDKLIIIEDDDYYNEDFLSHIVRWLDRADLVGEMRACYYNLQTQAYKKLGNKGHASLCSTGMQGHAIEAFRNECRNNHTFIDLELWKNFQGKKFLSDTQYVVGIKGLPGRAGIGSGHHMKPSLNAAIKEDSDHSKLKEWVGEDYIHYVERQS